MLAPLGDILAKCNDSDIRTATDVAGVVGMDGTILCPVRGHALDGLAPYPDSIVAADMAVETMSRGQDVARANHNPGARHVVGHDENYCLKLAIRDVLGVVEGATLSWNRR
jgi:hypothetical protein